MIQDSDLPHTAPDLKPIQRKAIERGIDLARLPAHVAVIMDGNGRWANEHGFERLKGHKQGYHNLKCVLQHFAHLGIDILTVYGFSVENWRRPEDEVTGLMALIEYAARNELDDLTESNVKVIVSGRVDELPQEIRAALTDLVESTAQNSGIVLNLALNYGGRAEIVDAIKRIMQSGLSPEQVEEETISKHLYHPDLPEPDLVIRTAGEMRLSNFLIWQAAYAELYVTDSTWPEFGEDHVLDAVKAFQCRDRKFGGLSGEGGGA